MARRNVVTVSPKSSYFPNIDIVTPMNLDSRFYLGKTTVKLTNPWPIGVVAKDRPFSRKDCR